MKYSLIIISLILTTFFLDACQYPGKMLVGSWKLDVNKVKILDSSHSSNFAKDFLHASIAISGKDELRFTSDHHFELLDSTGKLFQPNSNLPFPTLSGSQYELLIEGNKKYITFTNPRNKIKDSIEVIKLSDHELELAKSNVVTTYKKIKN